MWAIKPEAGFSFFCILITSTAIIKISWLITSPLSVNQHRRSMELSQFLLTCTAIFGTWLNLRLQTLQGVTYFKHSSECFSKLLSSQNNNSFPYLEHIVLHHRTLNVIVRVK